MVSSTSGSLSSARIAPAPRQSGSLEAPLENGAFVREDTDASALSKVPSIEDDELAKISCAGHIWRFLDDPSSSKAAQCYSVALMGLITFSVVVFCVESLPRFYEESQGDEETIWDRIEFCCVVIFTSEYVLRLFTCPSKSAFLRDFLNFVDLIAIVPFYLERAASYLLLPGDAAVFRVVRLVRVFRVFKISRYLSWIRIFVVAMQNSTQPLTMLLFVMMVGCVFFSSGMFFLERGDFDLDRGVYLRSDGSESPFQSIPATFWWCLVTMTTVGYGDVYPITPGGKLLATVTSLAGILV
ncbi:Potassium voltage-gated channel protein Shaker [Hondaea fermentalgiana]|uniref:Potassium voltage-gated channel protein Shaker n=1 Tax=Hondaea fermentalgiana TaxID=2315210 RepID=A0A2R5GM09_9STRA|nr:Potassium voltage-gated channel protein Shaker [Hondaea fermentalgiana]|eukprot:GBG28904.1 Potassium voltage-gated channel protein Shaker [Hondaea fermentalgiana]